MSTNIQQEFRKFHQCSHGSRILLDDTFTAFEEFYISDVVKDALKAIFVQNGMMSYLKSITERRFPNIVVFGQNCTGRARFVNHLLNQPLLPLNSSQWRWIRISHGHTKEIRLTIEQEYEIVGKLKVQEGPWTTIPESDLIRSNDESLEEVCFTLDVKLNNNFLNDKVRILIPPDSTLDTFDNILNSVLEFHVFPLLIYVLSDKMLTEEQNSQIFKIKCRYKDYPILFVSMSDSVNSSQTNLESTRENPCTKESEEENITQSQEKNDSIKSCTVQESIEEHIKRLCFAKIDIKETEEDRLICFKYRIQDNVIKENEIKEKLPLFVQNIFKSYLLQVSSKLSEIHNRSLKSFVLTAFDMAREIQITPRRISYAYAAEMELYNSLMKITGEKQEEISKIIYSTLQDMKSNLAEVVEAAHCENLALDAKDRPCAKELAKRIQSTVTTILGKAVITQLINSASCLRESITGTLQRCLENLEKNYQEQEDLLASNAVKKIISAAYNIEVKCTDSFPAINSFLYKLRQVVHNFQMPWIACSQPKCDLHWQLNHVGNIIDSLSPLKIAKSVTTQFQEALTRSHEGFLSAMRSLENQLSGKLEQTEEQRLALRKQYAPRFARLALESTSLYDLIQYGMPVQSNEIGRGQYGVVFACEPWGNINPCAVKSIVPPDERHWNDLAMEFYYARTIPEHPRIVKLAGSVIDHQYGGGCSSAVLLIMDRMTRDLYCGIRSGLSWRKRLQIAIDVIEGIRYLHSQGLVHRDIKLKNVLLDRDDRAKLTDFGFCIPEAMMSGSIVGTPVHMSPELLSGHYDASVDIYAFGILFWYICANQIRLPFVFEQFQNKEQLWSSVRKGVRPECLPHFSEECWNLMEQCWAAEPSARPLLGNVQPILESILKSTEESPSGKSFVPNCSPPYQRRYKMQHDDTYQYQYPINELREF